MEPWIDLIRDRINENISKTNNEIKTKFKIKGEHISWNFNLENLEGNLYLR